jgi:hypothetical protein
VSDIPDYRPRRFFVFDPARAVSLPSSRNAPALTPIHVVEAVSSGKEET